VKKFLLATTLLVVCSLNFVETLSATNVNHPQNGNSVTQWNAIAIQVLASDPGLVLDSRAYAIMHAAIHDAVNGVDRRYQPYTADLSSPGANVDAAVAAAAHDVLVVVSPSRQAPVEIAYAAALLAIPNGPAKDAGIKLGQQSAKANLDRRTNDGLANANEPSYVPNGKPGDYDFTPPFDAPPFGPAALLPGWGRVTPFGIQLSEHQLPGPLSLTSDEYARDFNFVKAIGKLDSTVRTAEQTDIAYFWFEFTPIGWNRIANTIVRQRHLDLWTSARVMALVNFAMADGYIAGFAGKYQFRNWRPYTAIRRADEDGNPTTTADKTWLPPLSLFHPFLTTLQPTAFWEQPQLRSWPKSSEITHPSWRPVLRCPG